MKSAVKFEDFNDDMQRKIELLKRKSESPARGGGGKNNKLGAAADSNKRLG